jgi:hypothetical protein
MASSRTIVRSSRSIAGALLIACGIFILHNKLEAVLACLVHILSTDRCQGLGVLPALVLAIPQLVRAQAANHPASMQALFQHVLLSSWPLLLVIFGTVLTRETCRDELNSLPEKDC